MKKRILSMLLVIVMVLSLVPVSALADSAISVTGTQKAAVGDEVIFSATADSADLVDAEWVSSNSSTAEITKVDGNKCTIKGVGQGAAKITVSKEGYTSSERWVSFYIKQENVAIVGSDTVTAGETVQLSFVVPEGVTNQVVGWTLDEGCKTYASIDSTTANPMTLSVNADAVGKKVKVNLSFNGASTSKELTVVAPVPGEITVTADTSVIMTARTATLTASIEGKTITNDYTWEVVESSEEGVVTPDGSSSNVCTVRGNKAGYAKIVATRTIDGKLYESEPFIVTVKDRTALTIQPLDNKDKVYTTKSVTMGVFDADGKQMEGVRWFLSGNPSAKIDEKTGVLTAGSSAENVTVTAYINDEYTIAPLKDFPVVQNTMKICKKGETKALTQIDVNDVIDLEVLDAEDDLVADATIAKGTGADDVVEVITTSEDTYQLKGLQKSASSVTITATKSGFADLNQNINVYNKSFVVKDENDNVLSNDDVITVYVGDPALKLKAVDGDKVLSAFWYSDEANAEITLNGGELTGKQKTDEGETVTIKVDVNGYDRVTLKAEVREKILLTNVKLKDTVKTPVEVRVGTNVKLEDILDFAPSEATHKIIDWDSSDEKILKVENGELVAYAYGAVTVTGTYETASGEKKTVSFQVKTKSAEGIELSAGMSDELVCGESMELSAVLKNAAGEVLDMPVQWRLKDKVIKNLVDLTGNTLTAFPQSAYDFTVELEAYVGDTSVEPLTVPIHVVPRTTKITLMNGTKNVTDKSSMLNLDDTAAASAGITIRAEFTPADSRKKVSWQVLDPNGVCRHTADDDTLTVFPVSSLKTGSVTIIATASDGTGVTAQTTVDFAKVASGLEILNAPAKLRGGETLNLRTSIDNDTTLSDRRVKWELSGEGAKYATISEYGVLDTSAVSSQKKLTVTAAAVANPAATHTVEITLYPSVKSIAIKQMKLDESGNPITDASGNAILINVKTQVNFDEVGDIVLVAVVNPADGYIDSFEWSSSNPKVVIIDPITGELTPVDAGTAHISYTAKDGSNVVGSVNLTVVKNADEVEINGVDELISGKSATLTATVWMNKDAQEKAGNQKVTWSVKDVYGNATKAASINSRGRLVAKTVNYGTEVVVYAKSVENGEVVGEHYVTILPKKARTFMAVQEGKDGAEIIDGTLYMNAGDDAYIYGQWFTRDGFEDEFDCTYFTSNSGVAAIEDGVLTTNKKGSATITVRATAPDTGNVYTAKFTVKVTNMVDHITISKPKDAADYVRSGSSMNLSVAVWANEIETVYADNKDVTWGVYEEEDGELVATDAAYMTSGGTIVAKTVTENKDVVVVAASKENPSITDEFSLVIRPANAYTVIARCEDADSGDLFVPTGAVNLEVCDANTPFSGEIEVEVYVSDPSNPSDDGKSLDGAVITWESDNKDVVKVVDGKLVYTGKTGKAKVTPKYTASNGKTYTGNAVTLNIMKFVESVEVSKKYASQELYSGKSLLMYADVDADVTVKATNRRVTWSLTDAENSSGESCDVSQIASINATTGLIRAKKGLTEQYTITVQATAVDGSGSDGTAEVIIYPLATRVEIEKMPSSVTVGFEEDLEAVLYSGTKTAENTDANQDAVKWSSSRSSVITINQDGTIVAKKKGTATIKATATDGSGKYATIKVTVQ